MPSTTNRSMAWWAALAAMVVPLFALTAKVAGQCNLAFYDQLVGYWSFENGLLTTTPDESGNGRDLDVVGFVGLDAGVDDGTAADFPGTVGDYLVRPVHDPDYALAFTSFTIQVWAKFDTLSGDQCLISKVNSSGTFESSGWRVTKLSSNEIVFWNRTGGTVYDTATTGAGLVAGQWHHIVVRSSGNIIEIFVDGILRASDTNFVNTTASSQLHVGINSTLQSPVDGDLDEVALWRRALEDCEIDSLYDGGNGLVPQCPEDCLAEEGWYLSEQYAFHAAFAARWNPIDEHIYVARRRNPANGGGLYRLSKSGVETQLNSLDNPSGVTIDPVDGDVFVSLDFPGTIVRFDQVTETSSTWTSGFHSGDDDPVGLTIVGPGQFSGALVPGMGLVVDRGSSGPDEVWVWSAQTSEGEFVAHMDDGTLVNAVDVAMSDSRAYIVDTKDSADGEIYKLWYDGSLEVLDTQVPLIDPVAIDIDPVTQDLIVFDEGVNRLYRISDTSGAMSTIAGGFDGSAEWSCIEVFDNGNAILISSRTEGMIYVLRRTPETCPTQAFSAITSETPAMDGGFGQSIDIDGTRAIVAEPGTGYVHLFELQSDGAWSLESSIFIFTDPDFQVAIDGDLAVALVPVSGLFAFAEHDGSNWGPWQLGSFLPSVPTITSIAVCGETEDVFIGYSGATAPDGEVIRYRKVGASFVQEATLAPAPIEPTQTGGFREVGYSLDCDCDTLVIGAPGEDVDLVDEGAAHIYAWNPTTGDWEFQQSIQTNAADSTGMRFGEDVAVDRNTIAVGVPYHDFNAPDGGAVFTFRYDSDEFFPEWRGNPPFFTGTQTNSHFGSSVDVSGDLIAIGEPQYDSGAINQGRVRVVRRTAPNWWVIDSTWTLSGPSFNDAWGTSVAISNGLVLSGGPGLDDGASNAGAVVALYRGDCPDCNEDYLPDTIQIATGLTDADADLIPDSCEPVFNSTRDTMHPTIQAAVDRATDGAFPDFIVITPGVYDERVEIDRLATLFGDLGDSILRASPDASPSQQSLIHVLTDKTVELVGLTFDGVDRTGARYGVELDGFTSDVRLTQCEFIGFAGSAIESFFGGDVRLEQCLFRDCDGAAVGKVRQVIADRCAFIGVGKSVIVGAAAIDISPSASLASRITNSVFIGNGRTGISSSSSLIQLGADFDGISNCTFLENLHNCNAHIRGNSSSSSAEVHNNIFYTDDGSTDNGLESNGTTLNVTYNLLESPDGGGGAGNIVADPIFVQLPDPGIDGEWGTDDDDLGDLAPDVGSPVIDAGNTGEYPLFTSGYDSDFAGNTRLVDATNYVDVGTPHASEPNVIDMGAHEAPSDIAAPPTSCPGDANGDNMVDINDLNQVIGNFGAVGAPGIPGDITMDGSVDINDLNQVIGNFGSVC